MSDVDADKVYDYHTAFDIKPTEILLNVNINANQKTIRNIALDKYSDSSAATVVMVNNNYSPKWRWLVLDIYRGREAAR